MAGWQRGCCCSNSRKMAPGQRLATPVESLAHSTQTYCGVEYTCTRCVHTVAMGEVERHTQGNEVRRREYMEGLTKCTCTCIWEIKSGDYKMCTSRTRTCTCEYLIHVHGCTQQPSEFWAVTPTNKKRKLT